MTAGQRESFIAFLKMLPLHGPWISELHHGDCVGVDAQAHEIALPFSEDAFRIHVHPPSTNKYRAGKLGHVNLLPDEYMARNRAIVECVDVLFVVPAETKEEVRSGTWSTYRYALRMGVPCIVIPPGDHADRDTRK